MKLTKALLTEAESNGTAAARKIVDHLRTKVYRKLSDDDMDDFVVYLAQHLDLEVPKYRLKENDSGGYTKFKTQSDELQAELRDTYNRDDIHVRIGQYHGRDRGFGKVQIMADEELPDALYKNMKNFLSAKGYEITGGSNFADIDPGERSYYPDIKFEFDIKG